MGWLTKRCKIGGWPRRDSTFPGFSGKNRLCNAIRENGKLAKLGSYPPSPLCQFRQLRSKAGKTAYSEKGAAKSGAVSSDNSRLDPDLALPAGGSGKRTSAS